MAVLARWCFQRRTWVLVAWLALVIILGVGGRAAGTAYSNNVTLPGTGSTTALTLLEKAFPGHAGDQDTIVWRAAGPSGVRAAAVRAEISAMLGKVAGAPAVAAVVSPYSAPGAAQVSRDGQIAYATVVFDAPEASLPVADVTRVIDLAEAARAPGAQVETGGPAVENALQPSFGLSAAVGIVGAAVVLFIAFGSLLSMLLPLAVAIAALASGLMTVGLLSHEVSIPSVGPTLGILIGLGVGIDYALFIVTRHRSNLKAGMPPREAAVRALNTSGRAVLFAGTTVCIALIGMLVLRISYISGLGIAAAVTVLFTVAAATTLLPALLGFLGLRVLSRKERRRLAADGPAPAGTAGWWTRLAAFVQRHPAPLAAAAAAVMLVLAIPVLSLRLGTSDAANDPASTTTHKAYELLAEGFSQGFNGPLQVVGTTTSPASTAAFTRLAGTLKTEPGIAAVSAPVPGQDASLITVIPATSPEAKATSTLISQLRDTVIPAAEHGTTLHVYVGGVTAANDDFATVIAPRLLIFIAVIVVLGFLLLMLAFRSLLIPAVAAVMNLLAAAASFGVLVGVFQHGWGLRPLNLGQPGPVQSYLPVLMLAVLFGLSMDYEVFLVSRIREEWAATGDNHQAVRTGQATTGRVIIAAATIMILVFSAFILSGQQVVGEIGLGMAAAVLLDAFLLRTLLVPALMHLAGRANWWLPGWLDRALRLAGHGACVALVARRRDRLEALAAEIDKAGGTALAVEADITNRTQAEAAVQQAAGRFGRLDTLVNNAGLMLLGPVAAADPEDWDRMIAINVQGLLYTTRAALPHLLQAAEHGPRRVADIVNISSIAGRVASNGYGVYSFTKFGVNGFTESLRQKLTQRHLRVGLVEPGGVATELGSHNTPEVRNEMIDPFYQQTEVLAPEDIADGIAYMVTRPRHTAIGELWIMPTEQL